MPEGLVVARRKPPKDDQPVNLDVRLELRLDDDLDVRLRKAAARGKISKGAYIRQALLRALEADEAAFPDLLEE